MTQVTFYGAIRPTLQPGDYVVSATLDVTIDGVSTKHYPVAGATTIPDVSFRIGDPLTALLATDIVTAHPPAGSQGDQSAVLPHIALANATLPYLRTTMAGAPGLVLLLLRETELTANGKPSTFAARADANSGRPTGEEITLDNDVLRKVAPEATELELLTHARAAGSESAVVLSCRKPTLDGRYYCLLVDVSELYRNGADIVPATGATTVSVLARWQFVSTRSPHSFAAYMSALEADMRALRLPEPTATSDPASDLRRAGYALLQTSWRDGSAGAALYRGPLSGAQPADAVERPDPFSELSGDRLFEFHELTGIFDASYAAAWTLGRLMALSSGGVAVALAAHARNRKRMAAAPTPQSPSMKALMAAGSPPSAVAPQAVSDFVAALTRLEHVPFRYLAPCEAMLPAESFRVFMIDVRWIDCLVAGALSLSLDRAGGLDPALLPSVAKPVCGALLRSNALVDFPSLVVEGFDRAKTVVSPQIRKLSPSVMLILFDEFVTQIDIHPHAEALHYGLAPTTFDIPLRSLSDGSLSGALAQPALNPNDGRLDVVATLGAVAGRLGIAANQSADRSAILGLQLIQGAPRGSFKIDWT